jgi:RimJ/RimL family protein N-acetyltransferase
MYQSERIRLRRVDPARDVEDRYRWLNDPEVYRYLGMRPERFSREEVRQYLEQSATGMNVGLNFAVETKEGVHIGGATLRNFNHVARSAEFAIMIGEAAYRGRGYGTEVTRLMLEVAFRHFNLNRVWLTVYEPNEGAIRAYEKAGFVKEGLLREYVFIDGQYLNAYLMAILRSDWERERTR